METGIPLRFIRSLLQSCHLNSSARVLEVGCGDGRLVALLREKGIAAEGLDDRSHNAAAAKNLHFVALTAPPPFSPQSFDLVLFRGSRAHDGALRTPEACTGTANLLSCLKPGGRMILLDPDQPSSGQKPNPERIRTWHDHLSAFPGEFHVQAYSEGLSRFLTLRFLFQPALDVNILTFTLPAVAITRLEWHRRAREAVTKLQKKAA